MTSFGGLSTTFLAGVVINIVGFVLHVIGISTTEWSIASFPGYDVSFGLLRLCVGLTCAYYDNPGSNGIAAAAMAIIGILLGSAAIVAAFVHIIQRSLKSLPIVSAGLSIAASVFIIIGVIIWGADVHEELASVYDIGYSLGLSTAGAILFLIGGICLLLKTSSVSIG